MLREFTDQAGTKWRVWDVYPSAGSSTHRQSASMTPEASVVAFPGRELADGWLCFECPTEKRRLAPIPPEWETCEDSMLCDLCKRAGYSSRPTPPDSTKSSRSLDS